MPTYLPFGVKVGHSVDVGRRGMTMHNIKSSDLGPALLCLHVKPGLVTRVKGFSGTVH